MFNISPTEILTISLLALVLFGPRRLPEIARKAAQVTREVRKAAEDLRSGLEREYEELSQPVKEVREEARRMWEEVGDPLEELQEAPEQPEEPSRE